MVKSPSEETRIGQLAIRFLLEGEASGGSVAVFEFDVPAGARVPIAHSHDRYEETIYGLEGMLTWTVDGEQTEVGPGEVLSAFLGESSTASTTIRRSTRRCSRSSAPASSALTTSARWPP